MVIPNAVHFNEGMWKWKKYILKHENRFLGISIAKNWFAFLFSLFQYNTNIKYDTRENQIKKDKLHFN